tara:strand:- start:856 stop:2295 length:1440 start_codon:yes stop_codon:yes gene_type:complete
LTIHYPFKTEPYAHQLEALERSWQSREYALFMEMGTGKSKVLIDNVAMLYDNGEIDALLLIAPKGVYRNWSDKEIVDHMPDHISTRMAVWSTNLTKKKKAEINHLFEPNSDLCILVINVDALITPKGKKVLETFLNTRIALFCIDESTIIKNPKAKRTKAAVKLAKRAKYRRILTGSPVTKSPLDVYSQCEFLNDNLLGYSSYYGFRNRYAVTEDMHMAGRRIKQVVGYKNVDELQAILKDFSYRVTKAECLDLPEKVYMRREFDMTKEQKKAYLEMKDLAISFFEEGAASVTAVITQLLRLHQISCGHLPLDDGTLIEFPNRRIQHLEEVLEESDGKTIIWANYRNDIKHVKEFLVRTYGAHCFVTYYGDTSVEERKEAIEKFQNPESPVRFFVGNTQTGGYGITLTEASNVVYYSNNYDLEKRLQSEDRAHRIGQTKTVVYTDLVCRDTIDDKIIKALRNKISIANAITGDDWRAWI